MFKMRLCLLVPLTQYHTGHGNIHEMHHNWLFCSLLRSQSNLFVILCLFIHICDCVWKKKSLDLSAEYLYLSCWADYIAQSWTKYEFALWKSWPGLCWCSITKSSVCHGSNSSAFKGTRWALIGYDRCQCLYAPAAAVIPVPSNLTPFPRGQQVT